MSNNQRLKYHLIGIGGIGMSGLAHILHGRGDVVSGSDKQGSDAVDRLRAEGMNITVGHDAAAVLGADIVVYSAAISQDNPEIVEARRLGIPTIERSVMLGRLMEPYRYRISVSGTHGKTTTTSMIDAIFESGGLNATTLIGGNLASLGGNARLGDNSIILAEACEAFASFLQLHSSIAVVTNIEAEHLDYYATAENVEKAFRQFIDRVDADGCVIANWDDPTVRRVCEGLDRRIVRFGFNNEEVDWWADDIDISTPEPSFTLIRRGNSLGRILLRAPGMHNIANSLAATAVAHEMGIRFDAIAEGLRGFRGTGRRFEVLYYGDAMVVDDYAHHPSEIKATLAAAKSAYDRRITAVYQPHLYSRTKAFQNEIADALSVADEVIVAPIYGAREQPIDGVTSEIIVDLMRQSGFEKVRYAADKGAIADQLAASISQNDMVLVLGAGDIRQVSERLAELLISKRPVRFKGKIIENEPMSKHTTLGVGGPADYYVLVNDENELADLMKHIYTNNLPWMILGDGANLLVSDKGIRGVVIRLSGQLEAIEVKGNTITAGSAAVISKVADVAADHSLTGLEGVGTVPGSVGGAIVMNAGTHRGYIDVVTSSVRVVTEMGDIRTLSAEECGFSYRNSRFQTDRSLIITSATFNLAPGDGAAIRGHLETMRQHRAETQPRGKSAGCFFKNPPNLSAGRLIESVGGKGLREGGAEVSDIHANFILNTRNASASDLYSLAERVREMVLQKHGVELEYEVRLVGEW